MKKQDAASLSAALCAPDGLSYIPEFINRGEESDLIDALATLDWDAAGVIRRMGQIVKRRELYFMHGYGRHTRKLTGRLPLADFLRPVRIQCAATVGIPAKDFQQAITSLYRPGAGIDWHVDSEEAFGEHICGLSLRSPCTIQFRPVVGTGVWSLDLQPRSLYILQRSARWDYQHHIPAVKAVRYSITLRTLKLAAPLPKDSAREAPAPLA